jgi:ankyrin repeat protein
MSDASIDSRGDTPLHSAVRSNNLSAVESFVANGAGINEKNNEGDTPLHLACGYGYAEIAHFLLQHGADKDAANGSGWRPIHRAVVSGHLRLVQLLVDAGVDPDSLTRHGTSALNMLQPDRSPEHAAIFGWLLAHGAVYDLYTAVACGMTHVVASMLDARPTRWLDTPRASTAIIKACGLFYWTSNPALISKRRYIARILLEHHADPNAVAGGTSPLIASIANNDTELVQLLIDHGADVQMTVNDCSPIQMAKRVDNPAILQLLLSHGARDDGSDVSGQPPF